MYIVVNKNKTIQYPSSQINDDDYPKSKAYLILMVLNLGKAQK